MTTGEKLAALRKKKDITQEQLAELLQVSRQSVSRWEMDAAFPETEKLIKLARFLECSIDFLLNEDLEEDFGDRKMPEGISPKEAFRFIRECGYFFLATSVGARPRLRPMGMIYADDKALYLVTDKRKSVYSDLKENPLVDYFGQTSGKAGLKDALPYTWDRAACVEAPALEESPWVCECRVASQVNTGESDTFFARIENVQVDETIDIDSRGIDLTAFDPVIYSGNYHSIGTYLGAIGDFHTSSFLPKESSLTLPASENKIRNIENTDCTDSTGKGGTYGKRVDWHSNEHHQEKGG